MKAVFLGFLAVMFFSSCSRGPVFPQPHDHSYVVIELMHPEGYSVSKSIHTFQGEQEVDLSGKGSAWKREAVFVITDITTEGFILGYDIHIIDGTTDFRSEWRQEIRFNQTHYLIELQAGFQLTVDLKTPPEER
ncbi:hypothetical protein P3T73_00465 [Kiritimatiellota bacterium B12222]|nr:hypothetical protein P3T73_00465 [Kiritimatiellota bacterium B12222]